MTEPSTSRRPTPPRLLAISDSLGLYQRRGLSLPDWAAELADAGVDALQIREKSLADRALFRLTLAVRDRFPGLLVVNGRIDVALAAEADGVHLPCDGLPAGPLRQRYGEKVLLGLSTHHLSEVRRAAEDGVDYVTYGPLWETPGKGPAVGVAALSEAAALGVPVLALGGVTAGRFNDALRAGAVGVAAIRLFQDADETRRCVALARQEQQDGGRFSDSMRRG